MKIFNLQEFWRKSSMWSNLLKFFLYGSVLKFLCFGCVVGKHSHWKVSRIMNSYKIAIYNQLEFCILPIHTFFRVPKEAYMIYTCRLQVLFVQLVHMRTSAKKHLFKSQSNHFSVIILMPMSNTRIVFYSRVHNLSLLLLVLGP